MFQKDLIVQSAAILRRLNEQGHDISVADDFEAIQQWIREKKRGPQNPKISLERNDFTKGEAFWVFLEIEGERRGTLAARHFDLGGERLGDYLRRTSNAQFGGGRDVVAKVAPSASEMIGGKMIFFGDLLIDVDARGSRQILAAYCRITMILAAMTWSDFDWMYAFITKKHVRLADLYGFTYRVPRIITWRKPIPEGRDDTHVLIAIPAADFWHMLATGEMSEF